MKTTIYRREEVTGAYQRGEISGTEMLRQLKDTAPNKAARVVGTIGVGCIVVAVILAVVR